MWLSQVCASKISLFSKDFRVEEGEEGGDGKVKEGKIEVSATMRLLIFTVAVLTEVRKRGRECVSLKVIKGQRKGVAIKGRGECECLHGSTE